MTEELKYSGKYLPPKLVDYCFFPGKITSVDKTLCGNGFSTSFLKLKPKKKKINIIIAPNKAVVLSKEKEYNEGKLQEGTTIKFFYMESDESDLKDADILFFVTDSFLMIKSKIALINSSIDKILIDEYHSIEIQSLFRKNLVDFPSQVREVCGNKNTAIVTVTASPNLLSKVDLRILPDKITPIKIKMETNKNKTIARIKRDILRGEQVVVFTNSSRNIYTLRDRYGTLNARLIVGSTFMQSLFELVVIEEDEKSKLTIVSGRGFEGFDIHYTQANVYFLEDRAQKFQTFYLSNLYQALSRTRSGAKRIEYCRQSLGGKRVKPFVNIERSVEKFISYPHLSVENKQKKEHQKLHPFVVFSQDDNGKFSISKNQTSIDLFEETLLYDNLEITEDFDSFLSDREITIKPCKRDQERITTRISETRKTRNLYDNRALIKKYDVFGEDYRMNPEQQIYQSKNTPLRISYLKYLKTYIRRKNYDKQYDTTKRQNIAIDILSSQGDFHKLLRNLIRTYNARSIAKYGKKNSLSYRAEFRIAATLKLCQLIILFSNDQIYTPTRWIANRNYNILTGIGIDEIEMLAEVFKTEVMEIDIKTCFPRVLYAMNKMELPEDFYGHDKENKLKINIALNDFFYDMEKSTSKKMQKQNAIRKFSRLSLDDKVIKYLFKKFFKTDFKGDLFNFLSFHEKRIITKVKGLLNDMERSDGVIRRHDSVIVFNNTGMISFLNDMEFLGVGGWFNVPEFQSRLYKYDEDENLKINEKISF